MSHLSTTIALLRANKFCILATVSATTMPWATPVAYRIDVDCNFYWTSDNNTLHSQNIAATPAMSLCVMDTTNTKPVQSPLGEHPRGLYASGQGRVLPSAELEQLLHWRYPSMNQSAADFDPATQPKSIYQFKPDVLWILADPDQTQGGSDQRVEVDLAQLKQALAQN